MKKRLVVSAMVVSAVVLAVMAGCKKKAEPATEKAKPADQYHVATVEERMKDPEYVKQLEAQRVQQRKLAALMQTATNDADRAAVEAALERNRQESMRIIRERMKQ